LSISFYIDVKKICLEKIFLFLQTNSGQFAMSTNIHWCGELDADLTASRQFIKMVVVKWCNIRMGGAEKQRKLNMYWMHGRQNESS
jgi:hypothetical protein